MDFKTYDVQNAGIKLNVWYSHRKDLFIGVGTVKKVYIAEDGELHISTLVINGELSNRAGLFLEPTDE